MSNFFSLLQVALLKIERIRKLLNLPKIVRHKPDDLIAKKGFVKGMKECKNNILTINSI